MVARIAPLIVSCALAAQEVPQLEGVAGAFEAFVREQRLPGGGLTVLRRGEIVHRQVAGDFAADRPIPIASASKWLCTAAILTLVDEGKLSLETRIAEHIASFDTDAKRALTLRHCLSCTNGLPAFVRGLNDRDATLATLADEIAALRSREEPGTALRYGGTGFLVAARVAEIVAGRGWHAFFEERIAGPLRMERTRFGRMAAGRVLDAGRTKAPHVAGGAVSTQDDYARFVQMLMHGGELDGRTILSRASIEAMFTEQTFGLPVAFSPYGRDHSKRYGLGTWIERQDEDGRSLEVSDAGAFGWTPWIDLDRGVGGVLAVSGALRRVYAGFEKLQPLLREAAAK